MRKSACFLAILGLGVSCASAQDNFGPTTQTPSSSGANLRFYNSKSIETQPSSSSPGSVPAEIRRPAQPIPNYYEALFGSPSPASPGATQSAKPSAILDSTIDPNFDGGVRQAEFSTDAAAENGSIVPVVFDDGNIRPFPQKSNTTYSPASQPEHSFLSEEVPADAGSMSDDTTKAGSLTISPFYEHREKIAPGSGTAPVVPATLTMSSPASPAPTVATVTESLGPQNPSLLIEWRKQSEINVGQQFECDLVVKNTGTAIAIGIELEAHLPQNVRIVNAEPKPSHSESFLGWQFAELKPGEERSVRLSLIPFQRGSVTAQANVRFTGTASGQFEVAEPLLALAVEGPQEVMIGESVPQTVTVSNPGTGVTGNVRIEAMIPKGLEHVRGERLLMEIGSLNPGESRNVRLAMSATSGGEHQVVVHAIADNGLDQQTTSTINVIAPVLTAKVDGPGLRYLGREGVFQMTVTNDGQAATNNVQLMHKIPAGFRYIKADHGVQFDESANMLTWFIGRLELGQSAELNVTLAAEQAGEFKQLVRAISEHGSLADAELACRIEGTSSLSIDVVDLDDPVETGTEAIYEVRVKNEGSAAAQDVGVSCELSPGMTYLSAKGPSEHVYEHDTVIFRTTPQLGPGETSIYRVHVSSKQSGNMRFRARVTSDSVSEPLTSDELTKFYED